jgi:superfamily II DNA helicase RecQ
MGPAPVGERRPARARAPRRLRTPTSASPTRRGARGGAGRAGRDGAAAVCVVYYRAGDVTRQATLSHRDRAGPPGIYEMAAYCQAAGCRRRHIALHLGDADPGPCPPAGPCARPCDRCAGRAAATGNTAAAAAAAAAGGLDLTGAGRAVLEAAEQAAGKATVATPAAACRAAAAAGKAGGPGEKGWGRGEWEAVVVHMLGAGLLALRFRQTRFATNAYVVPAPAPAAHALRAGRTRLVADIRLRL